MNDYYFVIVMVVWYGSGLFSALVYYYCRLDLYKDINPQYRVFLCDVFIFIIMGLLFGPLMIILALSELVNMNNRKNKEKNNGKYTPV